MKKQKYIRGGRPKGNSYLSDFIVPDFETILLTKKQYNILLNKYGNNLLKNALSIFEHWLLTSSIGSKYKGKNNYAHFRKDGWVINEAKLSIQQT